MMSVDTGTDMGSFDYDAERRACCGIPGYDAEHPGP
jgi:hypothetical protein